MQLWFWAAIAGMVFAGVSNFGFKIAAKNGYDAQTFTFYGGLTSVVFAGIGLILLRPEGVETLLLIALTILAGVIASQGGALKVIALRYIDTTIFFPLFKLLSPLLAVIFGIFFFLEQFTLKEWLGIFVSLSVPLLLISKIEQQRQQNLFAGLVLVVLVAATSSIAAALNKYVIDAGMDVWVVLWYASWGIFIGTLMAIALRFKAIPAKHILKHTEKRLVQAAVFRSLLICLSLLCILYAYGHGGALGIVQTIHSLYIVIPIILAVLIYQEHVDWKKVFAVVLSFIALILFG
jgi:drug/metabolite transporter (DMT)-like permease